MIWFLTAALLQATPSPSFAPSEDALNQIVRSDLENVLRDAESARITLDRGPRWATVREDAWTSKTGWAVCYSINAQNAYGGYTGRKTWLFVVNGDKVDMRIAGGRSLWFDSVIDRECQQPIS